MELETRLLKQWLQQTRSISELACTFDVSEEAMTRKLMNLGLFGQLVRETQQGWNVEG
jgi:predicted transcriptional regulator